MIICLCTRLFDVLFVSMMIPLCLSVCRKSISRLLSSIFSWLAVQPASVVSHVHRLFSCLYSVCTGWLQNGSCKISTLSCKCQHLFVHCGFWPDFSLHLCSVWMSYVMVVNTTSFVIVCVKSLHYWLLSSAFCQAVVIVLTACCLKQHFAVEIQINYLFLVISSFHLFIHVIKYLCWSHITVECLYLAITLLQN